MAVPDAVAGYLESCSRMVVTEMNEIEVVFPSTDFLSVADQPWLPINMATKPVRSIIAVRTGVDTGFEAFDAAQALHTKNFAALPPALSFKTQPDCEFSV